MNNQEHSSWVTAATFSNAMDAHLAKSNLEQAGITAMILDAQMGSLYGPSIGGVRLQVPVHALDKVITILRPSHLRLIELDES